MKLESAAIVIADRLRMEEMRPAAGGTVVAGGNGRGKTAATAALADLQAIVSGRGLGNTGTAWRREALIVELRAASNDGVDVLDYRIRIAGGRPPRVAAETLRYGAREPSHLIAMADGRGTWRSRPDAGPEPAELACADGCALNVAGAFSSHAEAARLKRWIEDWKIDRWIPGTTPVSEARAARPRMQGDGRGAIAAVGWMQEADSDLFEQLRQNVERTTGKRLADLRAVRAPDDQVTVWATVEGRPRVFWEHMPDGFKDAVRMEVRLLTAAPGDLIWSDCPDAAMDDDLSVATAARVGALEADGPQVVMLTRNHGATRRNGGPNRRVVVHREDERPQTQHFVWTHQIGG